MKILITGGAGFIGSHVVEAYLKAGHEVCVVDDLSSGFRRNIADGVKLHEIDIRDNGLEKVFEAEPVKVFENREVMPRAFVVGRWINISDLPEGRDTLTSAMQQVERTERVLKTLWREQHHMKTNWSKQYRLLESQSEQVRRTALSLLENLL